MTTSPQTFSNDTRMQEKLAFYKANKFGLLATSPPSRKNAKFSPTTSPVRYPYWNLGPKYPYWYPTCLLPTTIEAWTEVQDDDPELLNGTDPTQISDTNGLKTLHDDDFPSRIIVPHSLREPLSRQHHADLQHLSHTKVLASLQRHYYWPTIRKDVRRWLQDCEYCENEKAKRRLAHGMHSNRPLSGPRSRYNMDFQGQGIADNGDCEALAIIDAFTKTVMVIPLPDRTANTLVPALLDEIYFRRGNPDVIHSDAAPEFLGEVFSKVAEITKTTVTTTLGHNAQGNAELEQWWRYWNRCMRLLPPTMYQDWSTYAQRICWAYNSVPQDNLGGTCPFELDHGTPPNSPFAPNPALLPTLLADDLDDEIADQDDFAENLAVSTAAFIRLAHAHRTFMQQTTRERLDKHGVPATFAVGDKVKIYVPPTQTQLDATGRRAKHIVAWRGPCTITEVLTPPHQGYKMVEDRSNRTFARTIVNIRPYRATRDAPQAHHDPLTEAQLEPDQLVAIRDTPQSRFRIASVIQHTPARLVLHYLGTTNPKLEKAKFKHVWIHPTDGTISLAPNRPTQRHTPFTGVVDAETIPDLLLSTKIELTSTCTI